MYLFILATKKKDFFLAERKVRDYSIGNEMTLLLDESDSNRTKLSRLTACVIVSSNTFPPKILSYVAENSIY